MRTKVFISYSRKDKRFLEELKDHLNPLERQGIIDRWDDTRLEPGQGWKKEIRKAIAEATVAVLLISPRFLASKFILENELPPLLEAAEKDGLLVFPVIISPSRFEKEKGLSIFQTANDPQKPLQSLPPVERDRVWVELSLKIESALAKPYLSSPGSMGELTSAEIKPGSALDDAREWLAEGDYDRPQEIATAALIKARQKQEIDDQVDALIVLARAKVYDEIHEVRNLFEEALSLSEQSGGKDKLPASLLALAAFEIDIEEFEKAQKVINRSRKIYSQLGDLDGVAHTLMTESVIYHRKYQYDKERPILEQARDLFRQNRNRAGEGKTLVHLSHAYVEVSSHPKTGELAFGVDGKKEMEEALAVFELVQDDPLAAIAAHGLAFIERNLGEFENARQYFVKAVKLCQQSKSFNMQANFLENMGDMEVQIGNLKSAVEAYQEAVVIPQHEARGYWKARVLVKLGDAKRALGDGAGAGEAYQEAKNISENMNYDYGSALALEGLAEIAADSDRPRAKRLLYQAAQLFAELGYGNKEQQARKRAGEIDA